ncbi:MAG: F0F1 ATP synthase subunit delta [Desulfovibrio sp.]|jgi:F-type H+-transporting ATPase subunit delta|nr:F0F1 ATP synthase subunit delta [Desulfovibrio sp.]
MTATVVARRYANAIFALGQEEGDKALTRHGACLAALGKMIDASDGLAQTLKSPVVSIEEKKAIVGKFLVKVKADAIMRNFCFLLADKGRLAFLREIAACYGRLLDTAKGVLRGKLTTAVPLSGEKQEAIKADLKRKSGRAIELTFAVDKDILGGVVLNMGDRVLDASLRAQLEILRDTFKRGE